MSPRYCDVNVRHRITVNRDFNHIGMMDAIRSAKQNAEDNGLYAHFSTTDIGSLRAQYDVVVANLYAEVLVALSADIIRLCRQKLALAGILFERHHLVLEAFSSLSLIQKKREGDWISLWYEQ